MILEKRTYNAFDLIRLAFKVAPVWAFIMLIIRLIAALVPALLVLTTANFIDTSIAIVSGDISGSAIYLPVITLGVIIAYQWTIRDMGKFIRSKILIATRLTYKVEIIEKRARLEYRYIEDPDTYDLIKRVMDPSETKIMTQYDETLGLIDLIIQGVSLLTIIAVNIWWAALVLLLFAIPIFHFAMKAGKTMYNITRDLSKVERKAEYLTEICSGRDSVLERTLFGYGQKMTTQLWDRFEHVRIQKQVALKKEETQIGLSGIFLSLTNGVVMMTLLQPVAIGTISLGLFMSLVVTCIDLTAWLTNTLPERTRDFTTNCEYLKDLTQFLRLEETEDALRMRCDNSFTFRKLEFKKVSFSYPGTDKVILNNVNLTLIPGKHYAFVGENGAGKSTIVKLLTGQYPNYEGEILLNDRELKDYSTSELKAVFSVAYQDFARYQMTVKENMLIGNLNLEDDTLLKKLMKDLDLDQMIEKLPKGIDTLLGKIHEDGIDLSGGQWQRIVLARTMINPAPIKILDEPTAALDPSAESRLYEQFEKIIENQTSIFISHRLGSIKLADEIFVFDKGTIAEVGSHKKLMSDKGKYAQMYNSQLEWYQQEQEVVGHEEG